MLARAIRDIQFALLVTAVDGAYHASHIPMVLKHADGALTLEGHVARPNRHWTVLASKPASLAVFQGPQAYVSPSWYETKRQHGKVVPTWNYVVVRAHGPLEIVEEQDWLLAHLGDLVAANESRREQLAAGSGAMRQDPGIQAESDQAGAALGNRPNVPEQTWIDRGAHGRQRRRHAARVLLGGSCARLAPGCV